MDRERALQWCERLTQAGYPALWGGRGVNVHWRTILLPPRYIDYILAHELVHLCEPRHNKRFWTWLARVMPDFAERKQWLAENGGRF